MDYSLTSIMDMQRKNRWAERHLPGAALSASASAMRNAAALPFSFAYGGEPSAKWLDRLQSRTDTEQIDGERLRRITIWSDSDTGLQIRLVAVDYADFPVVEWTLYFHNAGSHNTPLLTDIQCLDSVFTRGEGNEFVLHGNKGDNCTAESYEPFALTLPPGSTKRFAPQLGKSSGGPDGWPYQNLQLPGGGVILALGWPGQWASVFQRDDKDGLHVSAGQERTHLYLKPGEEIRTPLTALMFWRGGDTVLAQNLWRRWFWRHNTPLIEGRQPDPLTHVQLCRSFTDGEEVMWDQVNTFLEAGIKPDIGWRDANWYPTEDGPYKEGDSWLNTGTWEVDRKRFPNGFRAFSDWMRGRDMKFLLWFEPERIGDPDSYLAKHHPEWLLEGTQSHGPIFNLGDPEALGWLIDHVDGLIKTEGIDWYREDMNGPGPLFAWRQNDAEDRQGITENFYVQGHLAFWDALQARNPQLRIDSCASGGRRNDLETMRRAVPLLRSDYQFPDDLFPQHKMRIVYEANQSHTYGISSWFPYYGTAVLSADPYNARSFYTPAFSVMLPKGWEKLEESREAVKRAFEECRAIAPIMLGDYYPLSPYSLELDRWIAWQFDRPESGDGVVQAFRRQGNDEPVMTFKLRGLDPEARYEVTDSDQGEGNAAGFIGRQLMEEGLTLSLPAGPGSALIRYARSPL